MNVCPQVTVECPACGHVFVAVQEAGAECAACHGELFWAELRRDDDDTWRAYPRARSA